MLLVCEWCVKLVFDVENLEIGYSMNFEVVLKRKIWLFLLVKDVVKNKWM